MPNPKPHQSASILVAIGLFKLIKAALLIAVGLGLHRLLHGDAEQTLRHWVHAIRIDPENHYMHTAIEKVTGLSSARLRELSIGTFIYASIFLIEGIGLVLRKRWAEYFTVISTSLLLPLEVYELFHHPTWVKVAVLVLNVLIVAYLIWGLYRTRKRHPARSY
jgi:uncharacterized membrane protein (DUF2068 family)